MSAAVASAFHGPVVVTGASGFVGRHLCRALVAAGADVVGVGRRAAPADAAPTRWASVDLADAAAAAALLRDLRPVAVLHLAGYAAGATTADAMRDALEMNVRATGNLLLAAAAHAPGARFVHAGTLDASLPAQDAPLAFGTPYGGSKLMNEIALRMAREFAGVDAVSARLGNTYGPDEPNARRLVPYVIAELLAGRSPRVSRGTRRADFVHVDDVVDALLRIAAHRGPLPASLDVGTGRLVPIRDVVARLHALSGATQPVAYGEAPERAGDQAAADLPTIRALVGWRPRIALDEGLASTFDWYARRLGAPVLRSEGAPPEPR